MDPVSMKTQTSLGLAVRKALYALTNGDGRFEHFKELLVTAYAGIYLAELGYLLGAGHRMLDDVDRMNEAETEEGAQLRVLLLWLAWDLGDELTDQIGRIWDPQELQSKFRKNAVFLKLLPQISRDTTLTSAL
jgi:hypothetical protein